MPRTPGSARAPLAPQPAVDWDDLRHFLAIARTGSLAAAARELGVEHTTVSRHLGSLEQALGTRLFTRGPAGLTLTTAGQDALPAVEAMAAQVAEIERRLAGGDRRVAGTVRLTIPESGSAYFVRHLSRLRELHPELLVEVLSDNRTLDLQRGEADLAVRVADHGDQDLVVRRAGVAGWSLYASEAYVARRGLPASLDGVAEHDLVGFDASLAEVHGARWLRERVPGARIVMRGNSIAAVVSAARAGMGIAPLPCFVAHDEPGLVRVTPGLIGSRDILVVLHPDLVRVARVRAVMEFLLDLLAADAERWSGAPPPPGSAG